MTIQVEGKLFFAHVMYIRQVTPDEHRQMSSSTFKLRFVLCPNVSSIYILLNYFKFVNTSELKYNFQNFCFETPPQAYQVSKHCVKM